ncbi:MAG TPA: exosortase/archaeosortase family protein, partial [Nitrospirae bacterium]|nr:exosortase/archaeosortase family protein [Nitrospirota bacterium]
MTYNANASSISFARISLSKGSLKWLLLGAVFVGVYFNTLSALIGMWFSSNDNLYGLFIPLMSIYIVWSDRKRLHTIQIEPQIAVGVVVTLIGSMSLYVGQISNVIVVELFSLTIIIPGLILLIFGWKMLKALWLPLIYLIFMFPL